MGNAHFVFAYHPGVCAAYQLMVREDASGYGVFDSHDSEKRSVGGHGVGQIGECLTLHNVNLAAAGAEEFARGGIVEASGFALDGYSESGFF